MNKENILKVADAIERHSVRGLGFNMGAWLDDTGCRVDFSGFNCDTTACVAGWAVAVQTGINFAHDLRFNIIPEDDFYERAREFFDIDDILAHALFYRLSRNIDVATDKQAVATLRRLAETGKVYWDV